MSITIHIRHTCAALRRFSFSGWAAKVGGGARSFAISSSWVHNYNYIYERYLLSIYIYLSITVYIRLQLYLYLPIYLYLSITIYIRYTRHSICLSIYLSISIYNYDHIYTTYLCCAANVLSFGMDGGRRRTKFRNQLIVSLSIYLFIYISIYLSIYLYLSISIYIYIYIYRVNPSTHLGS